MNDGKVFQIVGAVTENLREHVLVSTVEIQGILKSEDRRVRVGMWVQHVIEVSWLLMPQ